MKNYSLFILSFIAITSGIQGMQRPIKTFKNTTKPPIPLSRDEVKHIAGAQPCGQTEAYNLIPATTTNEEVGKAAAAKAHAMISRMLHCKPSSPTNQYISQIEELSNKLSTVISPDRTIQETRKPDIDSFSKKLTAATRFGELLYSPTNEKAQTLSWIQKQAATLQNRFYADQKLEDNAEDIIQNKPRFTQLTLSSLIPSLSSKNTASSKRTKRSRRNDNDENNAEITDFFSRKKPRTAPEVTTTENHEVIVIPDDNDDLIIIDDKSDENKENIPVTVSEDCTTPQASPSKQSPRTKLARFRQNGNRPRRTLLPH